MLSQPDANVGSADTSPDTAWTRLRGTVSYAFARVEPGQDPDPVPPELREWGVNTSLAVLAGILVFGGRQVMRNNQQHVLLQQVTQGAPTKLHAARAVAEENTQRLLKTCREAIRGAAICGSAVGGFCGVAQLSAVANGVHNPSIDLATAGALTGGAFGAMAPSAPSRLISAALGAGLGFAAGFPMGYMETRVRSMLPQDDPRSYSHLRKPGVHDESASEELADGVDRPHPKNYPPLGGDALQGVIQQLERGVQQRDGK